MVNWCPALGTVLANEEVIDGRSERGGHEVMRRPMKQWMMRITAYAERLLTELEDIDWPESIKEQQRNWIGKKHGAEIYFAVADSNHVLKAFTTRPDTLFGVTFFVIAAEHPLVSELTIPERREAVERYCQNAMRLSELARTLETRQKTGEFTGSFVINPITEEKVPVYVGDYVLMSYGTGAVMGVPAHDTRDFEFAKKFGIPIRPVIIPEESFHPARDAVATGEAAWIEPGIMLPCDFPVAYELVLEGKPSEEAKRLITAWLERKGKGRGVINYRLRDWLFSRQRYWGEPIPIVHWEDGTCSALEESELPLVLPQVQDYKPSEGGESPLAKAEDWLWVYDPVTGLKGRRETNTMPQWAGSCWYYLRFIDPHNTERGWDPALEKAWMPVDLYVGGAEHAVLHLLYARFWHKVLYDLGYVSTREPFQRLFNQGMLVSYAYKDQRGALVPLDEVEEKDGLARRKGSGEVVQRITAKMSKSLKNVVNPDDIVEMYGADTLRMFLMFMGPLEAMKSWDSYAIAGVQRFLKKAWNYTTSYLEGGYLDFAEEGQEPVQVRVLLHQTIKKVTEDLNGLRFNTAVSSLMEFLNGVADQRVSKSTLEKFVLMLSPMAPHLGEELWHRLGHPGSLAYEAWPEYDASLLKSDFINVVVQIGGKKRGLVVVPADIEEGDLKTRIISHMSDTNYKVTEGDKFIIVRDSATKAPKLVNVIRA